MIMMYNLLQYLKNINRNKFKINLRNENRF